MKCGGQVAVMGHCQCMSARAVWARQVVGASHHRHAGARTVRWQGKAEHCWCAGTRTEEARQVITSAFAQGWKGGAEWAGQVGNGRLLLVHECMDGYGHKARRQW